MAEEDFQIEPGARDDSTRNIVARNARWAEMFGGSSTNLAQRARYQEDISKERGARSVEKEEAFDRSLLNKDARDLYFKEQSSNLARTKAIHDMDLKQQKFQMDQERFPLQMENERLKLQVQETSMDRALRKEARDASIALRTEGQTDSFEDSIQQMIDNNVNPHSREFADGLAKAYAKNPYAEKSIVGQWFKNSKIEVEPEDFLAGLGELGNDPKNITATLGQNGWTFTARPKPEGSGIDRNTMRMDRLQKMLASPEAQNPEFKSYITQEIEDLKGGQAPSSTVTPTAPTKLEFDNDPEGFKSSYQSAKPGTVLTYNGKKFTKPEAK